MKISYSQDEQTFLEEVREWFRENTPAEIRDQTLGGSTLDPDLQVKWHKTLFEKGWGCPEFPREMGGGGFSDTEQFIFNYEYSLAGAPRLKTKLVALGMLAPLLLQFGTKEQQERFIPYMISGKTLWCQGFSEPEAGSDLASLKTKAILEGDEFVVNGQKTWTSMADYADWIFMLVRTDSSGKKQEGISFLLVDMKSPGVTIRTIEALTDHKPFCEVFFDNVRVPRENLVGKINEGWKIAGTLLEHERLNAFPIGELLYAIETVRKNAETIHRGKPLLQDEVFRRKLAVLEVDCDSLLYTFFRVLSQLKIGAAPGPGASFLKIYGGELYQRVLDLNLEAMGPYAQSWYNEELGNPVHQATMGWINSRSLTTWGGSSEIQRTIVATRILNLPRK
ncbi:MAG: acyl-CoA dehydrogenase family protein [Syntrophales bacterium]|nr:acyl-CoA dehydrogenase family protein [Syntrophales bacterium]